MPLPKHLDHDTEVVLTEHTGVTDITDLKAKVDAAAGGFTLTSGVLESTCSDSVRKDVNPGKELVNIKVDDSAEELQIGQRNNAGTLEGLTASVSLSNINYPCDLAVEVDSVQVLTTESITAPIHQWLMNTSTSPPDSGTNVSPATGAIDLTVQSSGSLVSGILNSAVSMSGSNYYQSSATAPSYFIVKEADTHRKIYGAWVYPTNDSAGVEETILGCWPGSFRLFWEGDGGGKGIFKVSADNGSVHTVDPQVTTPGVSWDINRWHFVAFDMFDNANHKIRVTVNDDATDYFTNPGGVDYNNPTTPFTIGATDNLGTDGFTGIIDRVFFIDASIGGGVPGINKFYSLGAPPPSAEDLSSGSHTYVSSFSAASYIEFTTADSVNTRTFYAGLANRERAQDNLKMTGTLTSGSPSSVTVSLPQDSASNFFLPDIYNPTKANFKPKVQIRSATNSNEEIAEISDVPALDTGAGTATIEFDTILGSSYGVDSLIGINPQPLVVMSEDSGSCIDTGSVEPVSLKKIGERRDATGAVDPPGVSDPADVVFYGYDTTEGDIAGRILGIRAASTLQTLADAQELRVWETKNGRSSGSTQKDRLYEVRMNNGFGLSGGPPSRVWLMDDDTDTQPVVTLDELRQTGTPIDFSPTGSLTHITGLTNFESEIAVDFPTSTYVSNTSPGSEFRDGDFSWVFWVKIPSLSGTHTILYLGDPAGDQVYKLKATGSDIQWICYNTAQTLFDAVHTTELISTTNYTMVSVTFNSATGFMTLNAGPEGGVLDGRFGETLTGALEALPGSPTLAIGADLDTAASDYLIGQVHTAAFFPYLLTSADEDLLFQAGSPTSERYFSQLPFIMPKTNYAL